MASSGKNNSAWACLAFQPITWSADDTIETASQILEHNAVWQGVCSVSSLSPTATPEVPR